MAKEILEFKITYSILLSDYVYLLLFWLQRSTEIVGGKEMEENTTDILKNLSYVIDIEINKYYQWLAILNSIIPTIEPLINI